jgi:hypothetical protein
MGSEVRREGSLGLSLQASWAEKSNYRAWALSNLVYSDSPT